MRKTRIIKCTICKETFEALRKDALYCSSACRQAHYNGGKSNLSRNNENKGGSESHPDIDLGSNLVTDTNLMFDYPLFARTDDKGKVLCPVCEQATKFEPVLLHTDDATINQSVPVLHHDCADELRKTDTPLKRAVFGTLSR